MIAGDLGHISALKTLLGVEGRNDLFNDMWHSAGVLIAQEELVTNCSSLIHKLFYKIHRNHFALP